MLQLTYGNQRLSCYIYYSSRSNSVSVHVRDNQTLPTPRAPPSTDNIMVMSRQQYHSAISYFVRFYSWYRSIIDHLPVNAAESTKLKRPANRHENRISCWPQSENIYNGNMS